MKMNGTYEEKKLESKLEITTYLSKLNYALQSGNAKLVFQKDRRVDDDRDEKFTNRYTVLKLFPDDDEIEVLKRELANLTIQEYIETVKDKRYPTRDDRRVFGKKYSGEDVYIKFRVQLLNINGSDNFIFIMSFHFAEAAFKESDFPYRRRGE